MPKQLPAGTYELSSHWSVDEHERAALAWGLGCYRFDRYVKKPKSQAKLVLPKKCNIKELNSYIEVIYWIRDLINTPAEDLSPAIFSKILKQVGKKFGAKVKEIVGAPLIKRGYPLTYAVGRASEQLPRVIDLTWGNPKHPKLTLIGKGVCYDTGGLNLKHGDSMLLMKKDMAGAAHAMGLAQLIMTHQLPVRLRVITPLAINAISGNSIRPGDILRAHNGITIEITNTDAEGRLLLADALHQAAVEHPEMMIDFATLTGAARVALGPDFPVLFSNNEFLAAGLLSFASEVRDPLWMLPLYEPYKKYLQSNMANLTNANIRCSHAGAITAAMFLSTFVPERVPWAHLDIFAYNEEERPGRPIGGEAVAIRGIFTYLKQKFGEQ